MSENELLLAISDMLDTKLKSELQPIKNDIHNINLLLENDIMPRLQNIESCYTSTYHRYSNNAEKMQAVFYDVDLLKQVVTEHSDKLQKIS